MKKYRKISMKKTGKTRRRQEVFNEEDRKMRRRIQEVFNEEYKKNTKRYLKAQKDARRRKKVIATELTVNSSISTLGMVYTLL